MALTLDDIQKTVQILSSSRVLNLAFRNLSHTDIAVVAHYLPTDPFLDTLILDDNWIEEEGFRLLAKALAQNTTLKTLSLCRTNLDNLGIHHLNGALAENSTLTTLLLAENAIDDEGAIGLADALEGPIGLKILSLRHNQIGESGSCALGDALCKNKCLSTLILSNNLIEDEGARSIANLVQTNTLNYLDLSSNSIGDVGITEIKNAIPPNNCRLECLQIDGNPGAWSGNMYFFNTRFPKNLVRKSMTFEYPPYINPLLLGSPHLLTRTHQNSASFHPTGAPQLLANALPDIPHP